MLKRLGLVVLVGAMVLAGLVPAYQNVRAQDGPQASTIYIMNLRAGPSGDHEVITVLEPDTPLFLEARNDDISWVLVRTVDGAYRGWVAAIYLAYQPGVAAARLPVSTEIVAGGQAPPAEAPPADDGAPAEEAAPPAAAPSGDVTAYTVYQLNVRGGPGQTHAVLGIVDGEVGLILEARNADSSWVLARTPNGAYRGWLSAQYLRFVNVDVASLPVSDEIIGVSAPAAPEAGSGDEADAGSDTSAGTGSDQILPPINENINYDGINMQGYDASRIRDIDLMAVPIVGEATGRSRAIFLEGRDKGRNPHAISKVGDCSSEHWYFLSQFAWGEYNLGDYGYLQDVINHFGDSLATGSAATSNGFNSNTVGAPEFVNLTLCEAGESPLLCEYRRSNPAVSVIMFGTSDLLAMNPYQFDFFMRNLVNQTIDRGIIPILSTFPGNKAFWNKTLIYNQIVVRIAYDYDIPLINLFRALEALPNSGLENDGFHLGQPVGGQSCHLYGDYLNTGYATRNLVTLQTLHNVWKGAMQ